MATTNKTGFRDLPVELRLQIYQLVLVQDKGVFINDGWPGPNRDLLIAVEDLGEADANEIWRIHYRKTNFAYLFTNLKCGTFDYVGLIRRLEELNSIERRWLNRIQVVCFFSTPERVAVAKARINEWLDGEDRELREGVLQFSEKYWCRQIG